MRTPSTDDVDRLAKDAVYITVGLGVLTVQQLDARRRELTEALSNQLGAGRHEVEHVIKAVESHLRQAEERLQAFGDRVDGTLDRVRGHLPRPAGELFERVHGATVSARTHVRDRLRSDAA
jgi:hypothetical protein